MGIILIEAVQTVLNLGRTPSMENVLHAEFIFARRGGESYHVVRNGRAVTEETPFYAKCHLSPSWRQSGTWLVESSSWR